jgi:AraC-like DNA-binding protein
VDHRASDAGGAAADRRHRPRRHQDVVTEIARRLGYREPGYFVRIRAAHGVTLAA